MNLSRFKVRLEDNKAANSKNGVIGNKVIKKAKLRGEPIVIKIHQIKENPEQARSFMGNKEFEVLKMSIKREGLLHPIIVYKEVSGEYFLKAGHRRLRALKELGYSEVECMVFNNKTEATFAAISTNEFSEEIHPIDKGVEVQSLLDQFKKINLPASIKEISDFYGVKYDTVKEWRQYSHIDKSVRAKIIEKNLRSKTFLRKATKICKRIKSMRLEEKERLSLINQEISILIEEFTNNDKNVKRKEEIKEVSLLDGPAIRNFLYYDRHKDEFLVRDVVKNLSKKDRSRLKKKVGELFEVL